MVVKMDEEKLTFEFDWALVNQSAVSNEVYHIWLKFTSKVYDHRVTVAIKFGEDIWSNSFI